MELSTAQESPSKRPHHKRNASSKSNIFKALVSPKTRLDEREATTQRSSRIADPLMLSPDHPHATKARPLGERQGNVQSPPSSPSKRRQKSIAVSKTSHDLLASQKLNDTSTGGLAKAKKSKSSTNLAGMFSRMNRSSKDLVTKDEKDKENATPPTSADGPTKPPIWAQYNTTASSNSRPSTRASQSSVNVQDEIARYTPQIYSPSKQRNFDGSSEQPQLRPTLDNRPRSMYITGSDLADVVGRSTSGEGSRKAGRRSEDLERSKIRRDYNCSSDDRSAHLDRTIPDRKISGGSAEQPPAIERLNVGKRGGRVMAAVAALQGKSKFQPAKEEKEIELDPKAVDQAFEAVLTSRNVPEPMRQKMRSLTLRVKADFVRQDQEASKTTISSSQANQEHAESSAVPSSPVKTTTWPKDDKNTDDDSKATKRSRARSRTFTFSKSDKKGEASPSKKQRSHSRGRSTSRHDTSPTTPTTSRTSSESRRHGPTSMIPLDYITYLRKNQDPVTIEVGRLHKLRILLRNETVTWVDSFVSLGGMGEIVQLLHRIMAMEWREEHEDQLLHETLRCLKGLCTTERAMTELETVADELFPALLGMLYDDEKKGPAEYITRTVITIVLFNFLSSATTASPSDLEQRAQRILAYLRGSPQSTDTQPVPFVLDMHTPRPYKLWCRELTHVTKEVFWIFLHHLNIIPLPSSEPCPDESYTTRHFPTTRPPVPAAPYIGGVEWDATTYMTSHLDLLNGLLASLPTLSARNALRAEFRASGFEKVLGGTLRTCKGKFYAGVHDALQSWVAAAVEDGWEVSEVSEGQAVVGASSPRKGGKGEKAPKLDLGLDLGSGLEGEKEVLKKKGEDEDEDDGWLG